MSVLTKYNVTFDTVFNDDSLSEHFVSYLKRSFNEDGYLFLKWCHVYAKEQDPVKRHNVAREIIDKYIRTGSDNEINISSISRTKIIQGMEESQDEPNKSPVSLFEDVSFLVTQNIKQDAFARYIRTFEFKQAVLKKSREFLNNIKVAERDEIILPFGSEDFNQKTITDKDIKLILKLSEDSHIWNALRASKKNEKEKSFYTFISNKPLKTLDGSKVMLAKYTGSIPYSAEKTIKAMVDVKDRKKYWDSQHTNNKLVDYHKFENEDQYNISLVYYTYKMLPLIQDFECLKMNTIVYDNKRQCYVWVMKSTKAYGRHPEMKRAIPFTFYYSVVVNHVSDNLCRYSFILVYYMSKMDHPLMLKFALRNEAYDNQIGMLKLLQESEKNGFAMGKNTNGFEKTLEDFMTKTNGGKTWDISDLDF